MTTGARRRGPLWVAGLERRRSWIVAAGRKVLWTLVSLWGVSLVTFLVVQMALAGSPGSMSRSAMALSAGMTGADIEELRKTYGWDLPVMFNLHVQDRGRRARRDIEAFVSRPGCDGCMQRLLHRGTLIFPEVFSALSRTKSAATRERLCRVVGRIVAARGWPSRIRAPGDCLAWWTEHRREFSRSTIEELVQRALDGDAESRRRVLRVGRRAVPELISVLTASRHRGEGFCIVSDLLSRITTHPVWCQPGPKGRPSVVEDWRDWWDAHELDYRDLGTWERFVGMVSRTRYGRWLGRLVQGRLGMSSYYRRPVTEVLEQRLPVTLGIGLAALVLSFVVGLPIGVWLGRRKQVRLGRVVDAALLVAYCSPSYVVGIALLFVLGGLGGLALFPSGGLHGLPGTLGSGSGVLDLVWHATLPVVTLVFGLSSMVARYGAESVNRALAAPHILAARARGLPEQRVVWNHAVRNSLLPLINLLGLMIPALVTGAVVVETIFELPGLGQALMMALWNRDPNLFMGVLVVSALATMLGIGMADFGMWLADPRLRRRDGGAP